MQPQTGRIRMRSIVSRVYDATEALLWAGLAAFVVYFVAFIAPQIPKNRAILDARRLSAIAAEQGAYCDKWGKHAGTREHALCVLDLQEYRARIERQYADAIPF